MTVWSGWLKYIVVGHNRQGEQMTQEEMEQLREDVGLLHSIDTTRGMGWESERALERVLEFLEQQILK